MWWNYGRGFITFRKTLIRWNYGLEAQRKIKEGFDHDLSDVVMN
jgi:hypothetical protein